MSLSSYLMHIIWFNLGTCKLYMQIQWWLNCWKTCTYCHKVVSLAMPTWIIFSCGWIFLWFTNNLQIKCSIAPVFIYLITAFDDLRLDNHASALISFIEELSRPGEHLYDIDKLNPVASHWSLSTVKRALALHNDISFGIILARTNYLQPEFPEFIAQSAAIVRKSVSTN